MWFVRSGGRSLNEIELLRMDHSGYHVILEPSPEGGYVAVVPAFPGCYSQGESAEEAIRNAREAIELTIEDMRANGESDS